MSKILIIDDEIDLVMLLEEELKERGHEVLIAYNGQTGVELSRQQPDLILLDIMMPKMDGFEVLAYMNRDKWIEDIPVIMISSEGSESF